MRIRVVVPFLLLCALMFAQSSSSSSSNSTVPPLIRFSGTLTANSSSRTVGLTFALYSQQTGGSPVWSEIQNVRLDDARHYTVLLGATKSDGLPVELFTSGEAQWLGVRAEGQPEQPRILMVSVPYALRAAEADSIAGHAITDFVTSENLSNVVREQLQLSTSAGAFNVKNDAGVKTNAAAAGATNFTDTTTNQVVTVTQNGTGSGLVANTTNGYALKANSTTGGGLYVTAGGNAAINAYNTATTGTAYGILGSTASPSGVGFRGRATATTGTNSGVMGDSASPSGTGVYGNDSATTGAGTGVMGRSAGDTGVGVKALTVSTTGATIGVRSTVNSASGTSLVLQNTASGKLLSARAGPSDTEVMTINGAGDIATNGKLNVAGLASFTGPVTFAPGQTFPNTLSSVSVTANSGLTASSTGGAATLGTDFTVLAKVQGCPSGQLVQSVGANGVATCVTPPTDNIPRGFSILSNNPVPPTGYSNSGWLTTNGLNPWTQALSLNNPRRSAAAVLFNGVVYIIGGYGCLTKPCTGSDAGYLNTMESFSGAWTVVSATSSFTARAGMGAAASTRGTSSGAIYIFGGHNSSPGALGLVNMYDISAKSWSSKNTLPASMDMPCVVSDSIGYIYVMGGSNALKYDPLNDSYTRVTASLYTMGAPCVLLNNKIYFFGGSGWSNFVYQIYDIASDTWQSEGGDPALLGAVAVIGSTIYIIGSRTLDNFEKTVYIYDSISTQYFGVPPTPSEHSYGSAVSLNGQLYAIGGWDSSSPEWASAVVEVYDPSNVEFLIKRN